MEHCCHEMSWFRFRIALFGRWLQLWALKIDEESFRDMQEGMQHLTVGDALERGQKLKEKLCHLKP